MSITAMAIGGALKIAGGIFGSRSARKRARALARQVKAETAKLNRLESSLGEEHGILRLKVHAR